MLLTDSFLSQQPGKQFGINMVLIVVDLRKFTIAVQKEDIILSSYVHSGTKRISKQSTMIAPSMIKIANYYHLFSPSLGGQ